MSWGWNSVVHVILLQVAMAFYYLAWPALSKGLTWLLRKLSKNFPRFEPREETAAHGAGAYRGNWRDRQYQRTAHSDRGERREYRHRRAVEPRATQSLRSKHLNILGLKEPAHLLDIKTAYRSMAMAYHPDRFASGDHSDADRAAAAAKMRQINEAYDWLRTNA